MLELKIFKQKKTVRAIFRVFLYIVFFNIVVRSDLWISICILFFISMYFLQPGLLKKTSDYLKGDLFASKLEKTRRFVKQWCQENADTTKTVKKSSVVSKTSDDITPTYQADILDQQEEDMRVIPLPPDGLFNDGYDVWADEQHYEEDK